MLKYTDLKKGAVFIMDGQPHEVLEYNFLKLHRGKPVVQTKVKNLKTGVITSRTFRQNEEFQEANLEKRKIKFIYSHGGEYVFSEPDAPQKRFKLKESVIGEAKKYLKSGINVDALIFQNEIINITIPIKMEFKVIEAEPNFKGDTAQAGTKSVKIETGAKIKTPMFINKGDIIQINTQQHQYVQRIK